MKKEKIVLFIFLLIQLTAANAQWSTSGTTVYTTGNVGIGNTAPAHRLHLSGNMYIDGNAPKIEILNRAILQMPIALENVFTRSLFGQNISWNPSTANWNILDAVYPDFAMMRFENSGDIGFYCGYRTGGTPLTNAEMATYQKMLIGASGDVGIGTYPISGHKLAVNGTAIFTKVKVKQYNAWPDYVFGDQYRLLPIADLEQFIKQNKHLPDMIPAAEVEKNGLDLADNQAALLKKIEELTLYIIHQQKEIEALKDVKKEMISLKSEIAAMKNNLRQ